MLMLSVSHISPIRNRGVARAFDDFLDAYFVPQALKRDAPMERIRRREARASRHEARVPSRRIHKSAVPPRAFGVRHIVHVLTFVHHGIGGKLCVLIKRAQNDAKRRGRGFGDQTPGGSRSRRAIRVSIDRCRRHGGATDSNDDGIAHDCRRGERCKARKRPSTRRDAAFDVPLAHVRVGDDVLVIHEMHTTGRRETHLMRHSR
mmetsp:Transcript_1685/g.6143  ORF Transcript_1685/g.6143 Transcript_1685/m.6143 type:complete len:204 (-) Transcript_1685:394-1005(-)